MIIVHLKGGLGNQMFQYAFSKNYALRGRRLYFDLKAYSPRSGSHSPVKYELESLFKPKVEELPEWGYDYFYSPLVWWRASRKINFLKFRCVEESDLRFDEAFLNQTGNIRFSGYFQNEKYFSGIQREIREDFAFTGIPSRSIGRVLDDIQQSESVSIHVRRGDYVTRASQSHGVLPLTYHRNAIELMRKMVNNPRFFIFTDDMEWVKQEFHTILEDYTLVEHELKSHSSIDMHLMSRCKHNITANSSFSWWGAWLNDNPRKVVVTTRKWCVDPVLDLQTSDIAPKNWLRI